MIVKRFMFEAHRRIDMGDYVEQSKPLTSKWVGLGTAAAYRPMLDRRLMAFHDGQLPEPRCMGWLVLTPDGVKIYERLKPELEEALQALKSNPDYQRSYLANYQLMGGLTKG